MIFLMALLLQVLVANAGTDVSVRFGHRLSVDAPGYVPIQGTAKGGSFIWAIPARSPGIVADPKRLRTHLIVTETGLHRVWLIVSNGRDIKTDEVLIIVEGAP